MKSGVGHGEGGVFGQCCASGIATFVDRGDKYLVDEEKNPGVYKIRKTK